MHKRCIPCWDLKNAQLNYGLGKNELDICSGLMQKYKTDFMLSHLDTLTSAPDIRDTW